MPTCLRAVPPATAICAAAAGLMIFGVPPSLGQGAGDGALTLSLDIDVTKNAAFKKEEERGFESYVYKINRSDHRMRVRLESDEIVGTWKGDRTLEVNDREQTLVQRKLRRVEALARLLNSERRYMTKRSSRSEMKDREQAENRSANEFAGAA